MSLIFSLSLLTLVVAAIINLFLSYLVLRSDPASATNRIFSLLGIFLSIWLVVIYMGPNPAFSAFGLMLARLTLFFITPVSSLFFLFCKTFPKRDSGMSAQWRWILFLLTIFVMALTVSPYAFTEAHTIGGVQTVNSGPGFPVFGVFCISLIIATVYLFIRRLRSATGEEHQQIRLIVTGIAIMFGLIIITIFLPVLLFHNTTFVPLAPLYVMVFLGMTAYAIVKHSLFNLKVIATEALTGILLVSLFGKIFTDQATSAQIIDFLVFALAALFGWLLVRSVRSEVQQREELERLNKQIGDQNAQLQELSRFKSQLLSLASHQIKSPLAAIKGFVSLIADGSYGEVGVPVKETLKKVQASADDLIGLINTLLDVRKVEEGKMEYKFERTDLNKMVGGIIELLKPLADAKKLEFAFASPGHEVWGNVDPEKFKQVVQNLTDNSIKYTPSGFVHVKLEETVGAMGAKQAVISVTDSGLGVPAELLPHLFEEFIRDERVKKEIRGTGLGLYIARKIAEAHGGTIKAESPGEGKGSTFAVTLPEIK